VSDPTVGRELQRVGLRKKVTYLKGARTEAASGGTCRVTSRSGTPSRSNIDILGLVLAQDFGSADVPDAVGAETLLSPEVMAKLPRVKRVWADSVHRGSLATYLHDTYTCVLEIAKRSQVREAGADGEPRQVTARGFPLVRWRWIVERTFAWIGRYRRTSNACAYRTTSSKAWMALAMTRLMLGRLTAER